MNKKITLLSTLGILLIILDQLTKYLAKGNLIGEYSENIGMAFSIYLPRIILVLMSLGLLIVMIFLAKKELNFKKELAQISAILVMTGGLSNLIDRIFRGYVIDFISIWKYPSFNFADAYITIGILLIIVFYGRIRRV